MRSHLPGGWPRVFSCAGANVTSPRRGAEPNTAEEDRGLRTTNSWGRGYCGGEPQHNVCTDSTPARQPASTPGVNRPRSARPITGQHRGTPAASTNINPRYQRDMVSATSHRTAPEDVRSEQGGIGTHRSWNRGQGAHEPPPVIAEPSPHFRVTITEDLQLLFDHETHVRGRCWL